MKLFKLLSVLVVISVPCLAAEPAKNAWLGALVRPLPPEISAYLELTDGFYIQVAEVMPGSPAFAAGLKTHDIITHLDEQEIINAEQFQQLIRRRKGGDAIQLRYLRKDGKGIAEIVLAEREVEPDPVPAVPAFPHGRAIIPPPAWHGFPVPHMPVMPQIDQLLDEQMQLLDQIQQQGGHAFRHSHRSSSVQNELGSFRFTEKDGDKHFEAKDPQGNVVFDGPVNTPEERDQLTEPHRIQLEKMDKAGKINAPRPSTPARRAIPPGGSTI